MDLNFSNQDLDWLYPPAVTNDTVQSEKHDTWDGVLDICGLYCSF